MNIVKVVLAIAITVVLNGTVLAEERRANDKFYECGSEKMQLNELEDGRLELKGKQLKGYVSIHKPTGMYRGSVDGWGSQHKTPGEALDAACRWLLKKAEGESEAALRKRLHEFYKEL